ncbi:hypothetical protein [Kitasatospora sp. NPDC057015]|uniref:hypothetical protein n=1 Tax=Kitasatospora sp. NPDC057015 TaxID=3346001 RepID=UPI003636D01C
MGTSTGGNESQGGAAGIQLPSVAWEMEEGGGAGPAPAAPSAAPPVVPPVSVPVPGPAAVPQYGRVAPPAVAPAAPKPPATPPSAFPYLTPVSAPGSGPAPGPAPEPAVGPELVGPEPVGPGPDGRPERRGRLKRPVLVAAATAGVVLMGLPFLITDSDRGGKADGPGLSQADLSLAVGPELGDPAPSPGATGPTATAVPTDPALVTEPTPGSTGAPTAEGVPAAGPGASPGTPGASAGPNTRPGTGTAPGAPAPTSGTGTGTTPGGPAPQQPAPQQPAPQQPAPQQPAPQPAPAAPSFSAVAGAGCSNTGAGYVQTGWWEQGSTGWTNNSTGGYAGSGCSSKYAAMPMSGAAAKDDGNSVLWTFTTAPVTSGSCKLSVFVPNNSDPKVVGGKPSYYTVQNTFTPGSGTTKAFTIDQTTTRGSWVSAGTFPLSGGRIAVMLHSRGVDWGGAGVDKAHHAASAVRADCTG